MEEVHRAKSGVGVWSSHALSRNATLPISSPLPLSGRSPNLAFWEFCGGFIT